MAEQKTGQGRQRVIIIGGGIAGLSVAHYLKKRDIDIDVYERAPRAGGAIRTILKEEKYLLELGPNAFLASADSLLGLARELSIDPQIVESAENSRRRFISARGGMHELPTAPISFLGSGLLTLRGKIRLLGELFVKSSSPASETLSEFVKRRAGREVLDALIDPFVSGVWAGDVTRLEAKSVFPEFIEIERECGSILRGMKKLKNDTSKRGLLSFRWGMGTLTARLEEILRGSLHVGEEVKGVERMVSGQFRVNRGTSNCSELADAVIIATPAHEAASILTSLDPEIATPLSAIPYAPIAVVHTVFTESHLSRDLSGFGLLISRREGIRLLGSIWSSSIFPGRAPKGEVLLTNYIGGATDPHLLELSDDEIRLEVLKGLEQAMGITAIPRHCFVRRIGEAIPQYVVGHRSRIQQIEARLATLPGIFLTGNYFTGVSVAETISHARAKVDDVMDYLKTKAPQL